jgi:hypothetical protein
MNNIDAKFMNAIATTIMHCKNTEESFSFANSFREKQIKSKEWLINKLIWKCDDLPKSICILGSWYSSLLPYMLLTTFYQIQKIDCVDSDPDVQRLAKVFNKLMDYDNKVFLHEKDAKDFITVNGTEDYDLVINTSCEHMPFDMKDIVEKGVTYAFESNNYHGIDGHINCKESLSEFEKSTGLKEIIVSDELDMEDYTRFLVIGKC